MTNLFKKIINKSIYVNEHKILKRSMLWNMIASTLTGFITAFMLFFVTRFNGVETAGIINIASAYGYQCLTLGSFGVRNIQASDVNYKFTYSDYFYHRIITSIFMYILLIYYSFCSGYTFDKAIIIFLFGLFKSVDALEDVYHGEYQRHNRLDIGSIYITIRQIISLVLFVGILIIFKNIIVALIMMTISSFFLFIYLNQITIHEFAKLNKRINLSKIWKVFNATLPICIASFISMYLGNAPKYAIDLLPNGDSMQGYFGILMMPVFTINLISNMIFRPLITKISIYWNQKDIQSFIKVVFRQITFIFVLTMLITIFGYLIGLTLLEIIYGYELHQYIISFVVLLIGGGAITLANLLLLLLTIIRAQKAALLAYCGGLIYVFSVSSVFVSKYGMAGASALYTSVWLVVSLLSLLFLIVIIVFRIRERKV